MYDTIIATNARKISCDIAASFVKALKSLVVNGWVQKERGTSLPGGGTPFGRRAGGLVVFFRGYNWQSGIFRGNPGADLNSRFNVIPIRLQTVQTAKGPCNRTQQVTTLLGQQCCELLALVAWCMQTNAIIANIVGGRLKKRCILVQLS